MVVLLASRAQRSRMLQNIPECIGRPHNEKRPHFYANSGQEEKPCAKLTGLSKTERTKLTPWTLRKGKGQAPSKG